MGLRESLPEVICDIPGPQTRELLSRRDASVPRALCTTTYPVFVGRGDGAMIEDVDGNRLLDWIGGVGVLNIGYSHPEVVAAVRDQAGRYFHALFSIVGHEGYIELAERLAAKAPVRGEHKKAFFANSGAECDENAIKVARAATGRPNVICFSGAFHGRTNLTMALTAKKSYSLGMGPFPAGIYRAPYPYLYRAPEGLSEAEAISYYLGELERVLDEGTPADECACVLLEPIQGEGGFVPAPIAWVQAVRRLCDEHGILLVADEVQCGNCRSGRYFASEYWAEAGCAPDILTTAKSMGAGVPISAIVASADIMDHVPMGTIGGTYCGNPLACAAALAVMDVFEREHMEEVAARIGATFMARLQSLQAELPVIGDVRGLGAMCGVEFVCDPVTKEPATELAGRIIRGALRRGLLMESAGTASNVIRFLAPLVMTDAQLEAGLQIYEQSIREAVGLR